MQLSTGHLASHKSKHHIISHCYFSDNHLSSIYNFCSYAKQNEPFFIDEIVLQRYVYHLDRDE